MTLCSSCETVSSCQKTGCKPAVAEKLYAVYELDVDGETWYFKKAFTSWDAANSFLFLHTHMKNPLKVVTYIPSGEQQ